jgi:hypothetical protein
MALGIFKPEAEDAIGLRKLQSGELYNCFSLEVKIKFTLEQATKTQKGTRSIALLFL